jgi:hypothetical protein
VTLAIAAVAPAYNPGSWSTYFTLTGTAAATLTGLFFVAFSLRVRELQLSPGLRARTRYLLLWLVAITIGSGLVLMPGQSRAVLAAELLVVSVGCATYTVWSVLRTARLEPPAASADLVGRFLGIGVTGLLSIGAGISLLAGHGGGLYLLAFAVLLGIALEVAAAWTVLVETGKHTRGKDVAPEREDAAQPPRAGQVAAGEDGSRAAPGQ